MKNIVCIVAILFLSARAQAHSIKGMFGVWEGDVYLTDTFKTKSMMCKAKVEVAAVEGSDSQINITHMYTCPESFMRQELTKVPLRRDGKIADESTLPEYVLGTWDFRSLEYHAIYPHSQFFLEYSDTWSQTNPENMTRTLFYSFRERSGGYLTQVSGILFKTN